MQRSVLVYYSVLLTSTVTFICTFYRWVVFPVLQKCATLGWEEFINRKIYAVEEVARIIIGCTYPLYTAVYK